MRFDMESLGLPLGIGAIIAYSMFSGGGKNVSDALDAGNSIKQLRQQVTIESVLANTTAEALAEDSKEALERYKNGCIVHAILAPEQNPTHTAVGKTTLNYESIREGGIYKSWRSGQTYSPGAVLCDSDGNTGVIGENGELTLHKYTGENIAPYVLSFFKRFDQ